MQIRHATITDIIDQCGRLARQSERLRPGQQPLAAFDADGTLWGPDVAELLWERLIAERALSPVAAPALARIVLAGGGTPTKDPYVDYAAIRAMRVGGRLEEQTVIRAMLQGLAGLAESEVYEHATRAIAAAPELRPSADGPAAGIVRTLREHGYRIVIVSGSPRWAVEVAAAPLGIAPSDILAGQVSIVEGVLTDGVLEPLPWGQGKIQALLRRFGSVPRVAMGNSLGDLAMLEATSHLRLLMEPHEDLLAACSEIPGDLWSVSRPGSAS